MPIDPQPAIDPPPVDNRTCAQKLADLRLKGDFDKLLGDRSVAQVRALRTRVQLYEADWQVCANSFDPAKKKTYDDIHDLRVALDQWLSTQPAAWDAAKQNFDEKLALVDCSLVNWEFLLDEAAQAEADMLALADQMAGDEATFWDNYDSWHLATYGD